MAYYLKDQLSIKTRKLVADLMAQLILIADSVETFRLALAQTPYFNGIELFRSLDQNEKGYLTPKDFAKLVSDESKKLLHYAFGWFDVSKVGEITKTQFLQFVFPHSNHELREVITERMLHQCSPQQKNVTLPLQLDLLRGLILEIMQRQTKLIPMRRILMDQQDYTMKAIMNCLDVEARGWITTGDFYKFLKNYDVQVTMGNVCGMLGVYDKDMNGKISMKQLQILVQGLEKSQSLYRNIVRNSDKCAKSKMRNQRCSCYKKYAHKSAEKVRSTSNIKKQSKIQTATKVKFSQQSGKKVQLTSDFAQKLIDKKLKIQQNQVGKTKAKNKFFNQKQNTVQKSGKKKREGKNKNIQSEKKSNLEELRLAFASLERQTELIDADLRNIQIQMGAKTEMEMQRELENAHIKKKMKIKEQQVLRRRIQEMEIIREEQRIRRLKQEETARKLEAENRRALEMEIQRNRALQRENEHLKVIEQNRIRELEYQKLRMQKQQQIRNRQIQTLRKMQIQKAKLQQIQLKKIQELQLQKIRQVESQRLTSLQINRLKQLQIQRLNQIHYHRQVGEQISRVRQIQLENAVRKSRLEEAYDRQIKANYEAELIKLSRSEYDWAGEAKIKALHEQQVKDRLSLEGKSQKESQYFWRYRNYCQNLASIADPLGIKQHLAQTDKYLIKSKTIRDQIKKDRTNSLNRYSIKKEQVKKQRTNTQNDQSIYTPDQKHKDILDTLNKRTQQTKLVWSNN